MDQQHIKKMSEALQEALIVCHPTMMVQCRRMFGGVGFYADDLFFAASFGNDLCALKLSPADRDALLMLADTQPAMSLQYVEVPLYWLDNPEQLAIWVDKSIHYVRSLKKKMAYQLPNSPSFF